jgi:ATP-dependent Clp protease ATP-binding subunit ClpX
LFIAGGAFDGIERIISKRLNRQAVGILLQKNVDNIDRQFITIHYLKIKDFGLIQNDGCLPVLSTWIR